MEKKIILFSSLCKDKTILELTLPSWVNQTQVNYHLDILVYDDNKQQDASTYTSTWVKSHDNVRLLPAIHLDTPAYTDHNWNLKSVDRIIAIKNAAIAYALKHDYDALFLVDADLVLHPQTLHHLDSCQKDFVFEVFWTVFTDQLFAKPNCWDVHSWDYYEANSILKLKKPGTYQVNAGGACTLLSKTALLKGLNFSRINNLPYKGEDRHICTRAEVLEIPIYIDTHFPAFHVFKKSLVKEAKKWIASNYKPSFFDTWLDESWKTHVIKYMTPEVVVVPKNKMDKIKRGLYRARRAYINYMRFN